MSRAAARGLALFLALAPATADGGRMADGAPARLCYLDLATLARLCAAAPEAPMRTAAAEIR
jgi:hypothetical protein